MEPSEDDLLVQMRKGVVEFCVLAHLAKGPSYGQEIAEQLGNSSAFGSVGSLYPLLARLRKQGWVETELRESNLGAARRYYTLTTEGRNALETFTRAWRWFSDSVNHQMEQL